MKLAIAALLIGMQTTAFSSNNYKDLVVEGYRWVNVDGPYASKFEDDGQRLSKKPTRDGELQILRAGGAYYLIEGRIVKVLRTDKSTGMAEIQTASSCRRFGLRLSISANSRFGTRTPG